MNPGSKIAIDAGCRCPIEQNFYGQGFASSWPSGSSAFVVLADCPLHGWEKPPASQRRVLREGEIAKL
jgi:hypothetical protein